MIPKMWITVGSRMEECNVGICDLGEFDILLGNDVTSKFKININVSERHCTYYDPEVGRKKIEFTGEASPN